MYLYVNMRTKMIMISPPQSVFIVPVACNTEIPVFYALSILRFYLGYHANNKFNIKTSM